MAGASGARCRKLVQRLAKVTRGDADGAQLLTELASRIRKLTHDAVERRTRAAGVNAGASKLTNDRHGGF